MNYDQHIANTYKRAPVCFVSGKGSTLTDSSGKKYLDFASGIAVNIMGHGYKKWTRAVARQAASLAHSSNLYYSKPSYRLAEKLHALTKMSKVFFSNSGAEANECAIKCARKYSFDRYGSDRGKILTLHGSFHGRTMATLTATGQAVFHDHFHPFPSGFDYIAPEFDDLKAHADSHTCALMLELIQGESGVNVISPDFVKAAAEFCRNHDILLIIDEVQTGNGRTGEPYAYLGYGISPDIVTTAKGLGGGLPIGATMMWGECAETLTHGTHGSTFGGNPVACAGACVILDALTPELLDSVKAKGARLKSALESVSGVKSVSGKGLMIGVELSNFSAAEAVEKLRERGLIALTAKDKLRLLPPLNITDRDLEKGIKILQEVLK